MKLYERGGDNYVALADEEIAVRSKWSFKSAVAVTVLGVVAGCAYVALPYQGVTDIAAHSLESDGAYDYVEPEPESGLFDHCKGGVACKIRLQSWKGDYLHRPDSNQGVTTWHTGIGNEWTVEAIGGDRVRLRSWKQDYLHRPDCAQGVTTWHTGIGNEWTVERLNEIKIKLRSWKNDYLHRPDSAQGVTTWHTGIGNEWTVQWIEGGPDDKPAPPTPEPSRPANPIFQCSKIALKSDLGNYVARCRGCVSAPASLSDSATLHVNNPHGAPWAQWNVIRIDGNRVALQSDTGRFLARCHGCIHGGAYPDSAFVHVQSWHGAPYAQWTVGLMPNGKITLQSDTGRYLARCRGCASGNPPDRAFVHSTNPNTPWTQWTVECVHPRPSTEGQAVKCDPNDPKVYRFTGGRLCWYPNPKIAQSWDPEWNKFTIVDCTGVPKGPDMTMKYPPPSTEGQAVKCDPNDPKVYRFTGGRLCWYPNPKIAQSWDPEWNKFTIVDCTGVPKGPDMTLNKPDEDWVKLRGSLNQISFDGSAVCGVNKNDDIFIATDNIRGQPGWRHIPGKLIHVVKCGDRLYGVNRQNNIYSGSASGDPHWCQLPGSLKQISCDGRQLCGVNRHDNIYCANTNLDSRPNWRHLPGKLKQVVVVGDLLYGVNSGNNIYVGQSSGAPRWVELPGKLKQLSYDGERLCGVTLDDDIYCATQGLRNSPDWMRVDGKLIWVSVRGDDMFGVDSKNDIFYRNIGGLLSPDSCANSRVVVGGYESEIKDNEVMVLSISLPASFCNGVRSTVTLTPDRGLGVSRRRLKFNGPRDAKVYRVRVRVGRKARNGATLSLGIEWSSGECTRRPQTLSFKVKKMPGCRGHSNGDPHLLSLDGKRFDFMRDGYFKMVESKGLRADLSMYKCGAGNRYSCSDGVGIRYADSVVRFKIRDNKLSISKATAELNMLRVFRAKNNRNYYRVFVKSDPGSYVDVRMGIYMGRGYLDVTSSLSSYLKTGSIGGLLGNGNSNRGDDETNTEQLANVWGLPADDNLVVSGHGIEKLLVPLSEDDEIEMELDETLERGFEAVADGDIEFKTVVLEAKEEKADVPEMVMEGMEDEAQYDEGKVRELCSQVIRGIPHCADFVQDLDYFIEDLCVKDTVNGGYLGSVDLAKLSYLDECRDAMDDAVEQASESSTEAEEDEKELKLADPNECVDSCNNQGTCEMNGCHCNAGFSGMSCSIAVSEAGLTVG